MVKCKEKDGLDFYIEAINNIIKDETIKKSLVTDLQWYRKKTKKSRSYFFIFTMMTITIPALTPLVNSIFKNDIAVNAMSAANTIVSSWLAFRNYKLSWSRYGQTFEDIKREIRFALTKIGKYSDIIDIQELEKTLFSNVEKITIVENGNWYDYISKKDDGSKDEENKHDEEDKKED